MLHSNANPRPRPRPRPGPLLLAAAIALAATPGTARQPDTGTLHGIVVADGAPVPYAALEVRGAGLRALADGDGRFRITGVPAGQRVLLVAAPGYATAEVAVRVEPGRAAFVRAELARAPLELNPVVVTGAMRETFVSESPVKVEVVTARHLQRNASSSLMESVQYLNGLAQQVDCGVCYTNSIRINGMEGPYTAVLIDGMPIMSALASVYGLDGISPAFIEQLEIIKGPSSTLYGTEAMAGVVNVITKDPRFAPRLAVEAHHTSTGESSVNVSSARAGERARGLLGASLVHRDRFIDGNGDGFTDLPMTTRASVFGRIDLGRAERSRWRRGVLSLSARGYYEDRFGGARGWTRADRGGSRVYGEHIETRRLELIGSLAPWPDRGVRADFSYTWHAQDAAYGTTPFVATQHVGFMNLLWDARTARSHDILAGLTLRYQVYDDGTPATPVAERRFIPGIFVQDEFDVGPDLRMLAGLRLDHHEAHGVIPAPRLSVKWQPLLDTALRLNLGSGFRVVSLFTEDHAALTGARRVVIEEALEPERSWSGALNVNHVFPFAGNNMVVDVDAFYTRFGNRIVPDYDTHPDLILYRNLRGRSVSRGVALAFNQNFRAFPLLYSVGITVQDVYTGRDGERRKELFAPDYRATLGVSYTFGGALTLDYTGTFVGPMRLPEYPAPYTRPSRSPAYSTHNLQATWRPRAGIELLAAARNVFDFRQGSPLVAPHDPFGPDFDTAYVWGPIHGRELLFGARVGLSR
mgnify:CR=1 FL=1